MKTLVLFSILSFYVTLLFVADVFGSDDAMSFDNNVKQVCDDFVVLQLDSVASNILFDSNLSVNLNSYYPDNDDSTRCFCARNDALKYHGKTFGHIALGFLFGSFAVIGTAVSSPDPLKGKYTYLLSPNKKYLDN